MQMTVSKYSQDNIAYFKLFLNEVIKAAKLACAQSKYEVAKN